MGVLVEESGKTLCGGGIWWETWMKWKYEGKIFQLKITASAQLMRCEKVSYIWGSMQIINCSYVTGVEWEKKCLHTW